jgi:hypothetical protein
MTFLRQTGKYNLIDQKRNEDILGEIKINSLEQKLYIYRNNLPQSVHRMEAHRLAKQTLKHHPTWRRRLGRPLKRSLDDVKSKTERRHQRASRIQRF